MPERNIEAGPPTILLCDDDAEVRTVIARLLECHGYQVVAADRGEVAVQQAVARPPSVILLDLRMPGMNGLATMAALKANPQTCNIPVVVFSSLEPSERAADRSQVVDWVQKPVDQADLLEALERALKRRLQ